MSFLYFIPKLQSIDRAAIESLGLADRIDRHEVGIVHANGPSGGPGVVICESSIENSPRVVHGHQVWRAAPKRGADEAPYWIGYWKDRKPTEQSLRRPKMLAGSAIELRDGEKWMVPRLVQFNEGSPTNGITYTVRLPQVLDVDDEGELVTGRIDPRYQDLWDEGWRAHQSLTMQAEVAGMASMTVNESIRFASKLMAWNYRVTSVEIAMLALFDDSLPIQIVCSAIDNETFWAAVKNQAGRSVATTTDLPSGAVRPTLESTSDTPTDLASAS